MSAATVNLQALALDHLRSGLRQAPTHAFSHRPQADGRVATKESRSSEKASGPTTSAQVRADLAAREAPPGSGRTGRAPTGGEEA